MRRIASIGWLLLLLAPARAGDLKVIWQPNSEPDLAGYVVYYGTDPRSLSNRIEAGQQTRCVIKNLKAGETYYIAVTAVDLSGNESAFSEQVAGRVLTDQERVPTQHFLLPVHPNPFHLAFDKAIAIVFELYEATHAKLEIFNILGQHVITLVDYEFEAGTQNIPWFGQNSQNQPVYTGVYLYRLETARQISTRKLVVCR